MLNPSSVIFPTLSIAREYLMVDAFLNLQKKFPHSLKVAGNYGSDAWMNASEVRSRFENVLSEQIDVHYLAPVYHHAKTNFLRSAEIFVLLTFTVVRLSTHS
ncbi:MAG: hypothetical protein U0T81_13540 [Saprospiraceae bacterium]